MTTKCAREGRRTPTVLETGGLQPLGLTYAQLSRLLLSQNRKIRTFTTDVQGPQATITSRSVKTMDFSPGIEPRLTHSKCAVLPLRRQEDETMAPTTGLEPIFTD